MRFVASRSMVIRDRFDVLPREPGFVSPEEVWEGLLEDATLEPNLESKDWSGQTKQCDRKGSCDIIKHLRGPSG